MSLVQLGNSNPSTQDTRSMVVPHLASSLNFKVFSQEIDIFPSWGWNKQGIKVERESDVNTHTLISCAQFLLTVELGARASEQRDTCDHNQIHSVLSLHQDLVRIKKSRYYSEENSSDHDRQTGALPT